MHLISLAEQELEGERAKGKRMVDELVKQTKMMDLVINFRDQECARDVNELTHENTELSEKLEIWKERAQMLQQERWGFVQKFRAARAQAAGGSGGGAFDAIGLGADESDSDEEGNDDESDEDDEEGEDESEGSDEEQGRQGVCTVRIARLQHEHLKSVYNNT